MNKKEFKEKYCSKECNCDKGIVETGDFIRCIDKNITENKEKYIDK